MYYKKNIFFLLFFVLIFAFGFFVGIFFIKQNVNIDKEKILSSCWDDARKQLVGTCRPISEITQNLVETNFYGNLIDINFEEKKVIIDPAPLSDGEDNISALTLKITPDTLIEKMMKKDEAAYQEELKQYNIDFVNNPDMPYPLQYYKEKVDFNALENNQSITVTSDSDIRNKNEVNALKILINYQD